MSPLPPPPRAVRLLLGKILPREVREEILGDLEELFRRRWVREGPTAAGRWYWKNALALSGSFLMERTAERWRSAGSGFSWLDVKLSLRMLVKYPGVTLAGGLGMTVAIGLGAGFFDFSRDLFRPRLPLEDGERVMAIQNQDVSTDRAERRSLHDFRRWEAALESFQELGAFRTVHRNLIHPDGRAEPIPVAEISASGFGVARVPPGLGRPLLAIDERPGAPPVAVIGHELWRSRFGGDPDVLGATIQLGGTRHTVVGVMPEGFRFPIHHRAWIPMPAEPRYEPREGPSVFIFGRLRPGIDVARARAEVERLGRIMAAESPATHAHLRPRVVSYTAQFNDLDSRAAGILQILFTVLVLVPCANVAILVYARTMTRRNEIAVRSALGAGRRRIVSQVFVEVLVLAALSAAIGLAAASWALGPVNAMMGQGGEGLPFWWNPGLAPSTILYALGLTVLAAVVAGVLPALRLTGTRLQTALRQSGAGGSGIRLGRSWTGVVVSQVALSVVFLPPVLDEVVEGIGYLGHEPGFRAEDYLSARLVLGGEPGTDAEAGAMAAFESHLEDVVEELIRRLEGEPGVAGVTWASRLPGQEQPKAVIEVGDRARDGDESPLEEVRTLTVATNFFDVLGASIGAGRSFAPTDGGPGAGVVVVSRSFAEEVLGGENAVGRRLRYASSGDEEPGQWHEIVGVVDDLAPNPLNPGDVEARVYHPADLASLQRLHLAIRVEPGPQSLAPRLRTMAAEIDPALRLYDVMALTEVARIARMGMQVFYTVLGLASLSVLLLTMIGAYALMSFTVAQRRREIGIRAALGAEPHRLVMDILSRALRTLALGVVLGFALVLALDTAAPQGPFMPERGPVLMLTVAALMVGMGAVAAIGPARRGLAIQPSEALQQGG